MCLKRIAATAALSVAADVARANEVAPSDEVIATAKIEIDGIRVMVIISKDTGEQAAETKQAPKLTPLQKDALEAAPSRLHNPVSMRKLASLSGYCYNSYFRESINTLVDLGLLLRLPRGIRKP